MRRINIDDYFLNDNGFWEKVGAAFTDPDSAFQFPIKPLQFDMTKETKTAIYVGAGILAFGAIMTAVIITKNK